MSNAQLRSQLDQYLIRELKEDAKKSEKKAVYSGLVNKYPELIEYYIRHKEDRGDEAVRISQQRVADSEEQYVFQVGKLADQLNTETEFYKCGIDTLEECRQRVDFLKQVIENQGGWRLFQHKGESIQRESDLQILYRLTWLATPSNFDSEVNNGRGPVDFKASRGSKDSSIVEFKLAKNAQLARNLRNQVRIYEKANNTKKSLKVIFFFNDQEKQRVQDILKELKLEDDSSIIQIDCRPDNKPSASKA